MTTLKFGDKELKIKYGYEATIKSGIIRELMNIDKVSEDMETVEKILLFVPEMLLVGLQKYHKNEYGYDPQNLEQKNARLEEMYGLLDDYFDGEDGDIQALFTVLQKELFNNGFLSKMFKSKKMKEPQAVPETSENIQN